MLRLVVPTVICGLAAAAATGLSGFRVAAPAAELPPQDERAASKPAQDPDDPAKLPGWAAYVKHCAPCHGESGRGDGVAARFLDPPPRDFDRGRFRFTSTENDAPSGKDLFEVIGAGLPGTAMLPFAHLGEDEVWAVADVVLAFRARGLRRRLAAAGVEGDALAAAVRARTRAVPADDPADEPPQTAESAAQGLVLFRAHCAKCHGADLRGADAPPMVAEEGHATPAPDLAAGDFKQTPLKRNLFDRIRLGLPGAPMPAIPRAQLDDESVWRIVHYLLARCPTEGRALVDPVPRDLASVALEGPLPTSPDDPRFAAAPETWVPLAPMRRGERTTPGLFVRVLHAPETLALRITTPDATENPSSARPDGPPDGVAVRVTATPKPPVLPYPGQMPAIDRAVFFAGPMPDRRDPLFDAVPRFENPDGVCRMPLSAERAGAAVYRGGAWHVALTVRLEHATDPARRPVRLSFATFDGALRRGPMPTAFSHWNDLAPRKPAPK
ncbi:MAG TPA: c-type cytochrome [Planctomycetota bacterium]|nr:c-type cytochrome [Planctomycetota bacterium]